MSMVIYGLCCAVVFLLVVIATMAFGHRQETGPHNSARAWWLIFEAVVTKTTGPIPWARREYFAQPNWQAPKWRRRAFEAVDTWIAHRAVATWDQCWWRFWWGDAAQVERENAHLRAQLAETWGDPPTQLNLPQPEPPQLGLTWDSKAADGLENCATDAGAVTESRDWVEELS